MEMHFSLRQKKNIDEETVGFLRILYMILLYNIIIEKIISRLYLFWVKQAMCGYVAHI